MTMNRRTWFAGAMGLIASLCGVKATAAAAALKFDDFTEFKPAARAYPVKVVLDIQGNRYLVYDMAGRLVMASDPEDSNWHIVSVESPS